MRLKHYGVLLAKLAGILFMPQWCFAQTATQFTGWRNNPACVKWVDSVYQAISPQERIGQFFMLAAYTQGKDYNMDSVLSRIKNGQAGGVIFFKGNPTAQAVWTNKLQDSAKVGAFIAIDGEWGLSMRIDSTTIFPRQMTLGAVTNPELIYQMGREIGRQCRRIGININFAPVVDVNNNPNNPVINERSFGEDKYRVAIRAAEYARGLQDEGVLACAKHFPGHGDTDKDSHKELPSVLKSRGSIDSLELYPFKVLFADGVGSAMVAHLNVPALDSDSGSAASISRKIATELLKDSLGFEGLVFSDALNMRGVSKAYPPGTVDSIAFMAGCDILVFSEDATKGIAKIMAAVDSGYISPHELESRVKKVLAYKYLLGLHTKQTVKTDNLVSDINSLPAQNLRRVLFEQAITFAANHNNLLPFKDWNYAKAASLSIASKGVSEFQNNLLNYVNPDIFNQPDDSPAALGRLLDTLSKYELVIIDLHGMTRLASVNYSVSAGTRQFIDSLSTKTNVVLVAFGNAYSLQFFQTVKWLVCAYEENEITNRAAVNAIMGSEPVVGRLPVTAAPMLAGGTGFTSDSVYRLKLSDPSEENISPARFSQVDEIINAAINKKAFPGCQLLVAHQGKVIWNKAYGNQIYEVATPVANYHLYDLASLTKVAATTLAVMKLYEQEKIDLNDKVGEYIKLPHGNNIKNLRIKDVLLHQAGLKAFIMFWKETVGNNFDRYYRKLPEEDFATPVADSLFIRNDYADSMWKQMACAPVEDEPKYVYSDLDFYILQKIVERVSKKKLDDFVEETFYRPMGLTRIGYRPLLRFKKEVIAPTENDSLFRRQVVHGYVHDQGAAMYGGVAGHAGLFSNAFDVAALFQMLLNKGVYNGHRFLDTATIDLFTTRQSKISRRGYGFDKPEPDVNKPSPCFDGAPVEIFGHTGFTGTCVWSDPKNNLTYIFLSNRVYPNADNNMLVKLGVRTDLQKAIYQALGLY